MIGESAPMKALAGAIRKVAPHKATVLVQGESGTGKELIARAVHDQSPRAGGPFVAVNCGAIPAGLMESELFGHAKGAFTDALRDRVGLLEQSSGGTLFLDEVGELPAALQVKLLRALQEERVRRLGDADDRPIDLRLVAATARDLEAEVAAGRFREDLYHRINVVALRVPPLRDRAGDIPLLAAHFVTRINQRSRLAITGLVSRGHAPSRRLRAGPATFASWRTPSSGRRSCARGRRSTPPACPTGSSMVAMVSGPHPPGRPRPLRASPSPTCRSSGPPAASRRS